MVGPALHLSADRHFVMGGGDGATEVAKDAAPSSQVIICDIFFWRIHNTPN